MNINPYYGVIAGGGGGGGVGGPAASHFAAAFPFPQCPDAGAGFVGSGGGDFYAAATKNPYHHQNGAVHHLVKHPASAVQVAGSPITNGNNNNNSAAAAAGVDATSPGDDGVLYRSGRECNGKLAAAAYGPPMHVGSPAGYHPPYDRYRGGDDPTAAAMTPSPHRPLPPPPGRGQWSPSSSTSAAAAGASLSPEAAHRAAPSTPAPASGLGPAGFDAGDAVSAAMSSPSPSTAQLCPTQPAQHPPPPQHCSPAVGHHQAIPYYPWMGVVGAYTSNHRLSIIQLYSPECTLADNIDINNDKQNKDRNILITQSNSIYATPSSTS